MIGEYAALILKKPEELVSEDCPMLVPVIPGYVEIGDQVVYHDKTTFIQEFHSDDRDAYVRLTSGETIRWMVHGVWQYSEIIELAMLAKVLVMRSKVAFIAVSRMARLRGTFSAAHLRDAMRFLKDSQLMDQEIEDVQVANYKHFIKTWRYVQQYNPPSVEPVSTGLQNKEYPYILRDKHGVLKYIHSEIDEGDIPNGEYQVYHSTVQHQLRLELSSKRGELHEAIGKAKGGFMPILSCQHLTVGNFIYHCNYRTAWRVVGRGRNIVLQSPDGNHVTFKKRDIYRSFSMPVFHATSIAQVVANRNRIRTVPVAMDCSETRKADYAFNEAFTQQPYTFQINKIGETLCALKNSAIMANSAIL